MKNTIGTAKRTTASNKADKLIRMRMNVVGMVLAFAFIAVAIRAVELACFDNPTLGTLAMKQYRAIVPQGLRRGRILDRNGNELAVSLPVRSIYADPNAVEYPAATAEALSPILKIDKDKLLGMLKKRGRFTWLKRQADDETLEAVVALRLGGVYSVEESKRFYPNGELAGQVLGAVGLDSEPLGGVELFYDKYLASKKRSAVYKRDAKGRLYLSPVDFQEQADVGDVTLTIDKQIQFISEKALKKSVESARAKSGVAVAMDVATGELLAMATYPFFNPQDYTKYSLDWWRNRAVTDMFEPGSTFKVFVVAAALDGGVVTPDSVFDCERGAYAIGKDVIHDHHPYGELSVRDIIKVSSNIGALKIAKTLDKDRMYQALKMFGMGQKTGVDFPGEVSGILQRYRTWSDLEYATIAFGQGVGATPLQMASAFSAIANKGSLMRPYIVSRVSDSQGISLYEAKPEEAARPIDPATAAVLTGMLERVVEPGGTGTRAASTEYKVAGKTGTAQKVERGRYVEKYFASFMGFAPSGNPQIAVLVGLDEPGGGYYGGLVAAPAFREIMEETLVYLGVPPRSAPVMLTASRGMEGNRGQRTEHREQMAGERKFVSAGKGFRVPDLQGLTMRGVLEAAGRADIKLNMIGSGIAMSQSPAPGSVVKRGEVCMVKFGRPI